MNSRSFLVWPVFAKVPLTQAFARRIASCVAFSLVAALLTACSGGESGRGGDPVGPPTMTANVGPTADPQSVDVKEDSEVDIDLTGSDNDGDVVGYTVTEDPSNGALSGTAPSLTYTPDADFNGSDDFEFTVTDNGNATSLPATVTITVVAVNDPPTAESLDLEMSEDSSVTIELSGSDIDNEIIAYKVARAPASGWLIGSAPNFEYHPDRDFNGTDSLSYFVEDEDGAYSETVEVNLTILSVNDPPIFEDEHFRVRPNGGLSDVLLQALDVEGEIDFIRVETEPSNGFAELDGISLSYEPNPDFEGEDEMTVYAEDQDGARSRTATLHFSVHDRATEIDREILSEFFEDTGGEGVWLSSDGWGTDAPLNQWHGIWTWRGGFAGGLALGSNNVTGEIPVDFMHLGWIIDLLFDNNNLSGEIPAELTTIPGMRIIQFNGNDLEGPIPWHIGKHKHLAYLVLGNNRLSGGIPRTVALMATLNRFDVGANELEGRIYAEDFPRQLEVLSLKQNSFEGPVPPGIGNLRRLRELYLDDSGLSGRLPLELMNLSRLERFDFVGESGDLCASGDPDFQAWVAGIPETDSELCAVPPTVALSQVNTVGHVTTGITTRATSLVINNEGDTPLEITITTSDDWLTVSEEASLSIDPFRSRKIEVFVDCGIGNIDRRQGTVTLSTNDPNRPTRVIEVDVECLNRELSIEFTATPADASGSAEQPSFSGTVEWQMNSSTDDERGEPFILTLFSADDSILLVENENGFSGIAVPSETNSHLLEATCRSEGDVTLEITVDIGSLSETAGWLGQCEADVFRVAEVNWYQGPYVARHSFEFEGVETIYSDMKVTYNTPVIPDRRAVVEFVIAHGYDTPAQFEEASWTHPTVTNEPLETATDRFRKSVAGGLLTHGDAFALHLPGGRMSGGDGSGDLEFSVEGMAAPFTLALSSLNFSQVHTFNPVIVPYSVDPEDGSDPAPAPDFDMDDLLQETRDWLPIALDSPREKETTIVPLSEVEEWSDTNAYILSKASALYNSEGEADEFYHGVLFNGVNGFGCGGGLAYLNWQVGMSCVEVGGDGTGELNWGGTTIAHEFGHNFSLHHTPCGVVYADPDYPYANANLGPEPGWSYGEDRFLDENSGYVSYMSYCSPPFVSDFDYREAADWHLVLTSIWNSEENEDTPTAPPNSQNESEYRSIALMGRVDLRTDAWTLLQSEYSSKPPRKPNPGEWELVLIDRIGVETHRESMRLHERARKNATDEDLRNILTWFVRVPIPEEGLKEVQVIDPQGREAFSTEVELDSP